MNNAVGTWRGNYSSTFCCVIKKAKMNEISWYKIRLYVKTERLIKLDTVSI